MPAAPADSPVGMAVETPDEMSSCSCSNSEDKPRSRGVRLFGVNLLSEGAMRKSVSLSNLSHYASASSCNNLSMQENTMDAADGYVSDGLVQTNSNARARRKGVPWTEDEHRLFLLGLQKLGKGDWRGISKTFVTTRTPTQVASHAQKYFIRQSNLSKRKRRSSLFDISPHHESSLADMSLAKSVSLQTSFLELGLGHDRVSVPVAPLEKIMEEKVFFPSQDGRGFEEHVAVDSASQAATDRSASLPSLWLDLNTQHQQQQQQQQQEHEQQEQKASEFPVSSRSKVVKPVASISTGPVRIEDREFPSEPPMLSLKLEQPVRHSAFHVSPAFANGGAAAGLEAPPIQCT